MACASGAVQSGCPVGMTCWLVASHQQFSHFLCVLGSVWLFERLREKQWQHLMVWSEMKRFCSQLQRLSLKKFAASGKYSTDWLQGFFQITILLLLRQYPVFEDKNTVWSECHIITPYQWCYLHNVASTGFYPLLSHLFVCDHHPQWKFSKFWLTTKSENLVGTVTWEAVFQIVLRCLIM